MPPVEAPSVNAEVQNDSESISKPMVGIIYPPPEVRNIVDKTASFVARNGPTFEERIRGNEVGNPKFNFLTPTDPYHAYYQHKVKEFKEGTDQEVAAKQHSLRPSAIPRTQAPVSRVQVQEPVLPKEPPPEPEFICDPPSISAFDLDVVKLTAQFVARNGRQFLTTLMNKEQRNYQFDFLRPQHSLFNYFTKLVEQYTKVLIPPKDLMQKLTLDSADSKEVLNQVQYRVLWAKHQEQEKKKEEDAKEKERVAYAQIDWHDFVVVETVDYQPNETGMFPAPTTPDEVGARVLMQERIDQEADSNDAAKEDNVEAVEKQEAINDVEMELSDKEEEAEDMEEASDDEVEMPPPKAPAHPQQPPMPGQPPLPTSAEPVIIRQYDPKQPRPVAPAPQSDQWLISPLTQEKIPAHKLQEHMKISLLDPKWREQKERQIREKKEAETVYAAGVNIEANLRGIAERRTDIFGVGVEEAEIGKKIGEEDARESDKVVWDGHSATMEKISQKARENISIEEQIKVIHQTKGLVEDESKSRIGPSITRVAPIPTSSVPSKTTAPPLMQQQIQPPVSTVSSLTTARINPAPAAPPVIPKSTPTAVPPPQPPAATVIRMPQGVPAPQPMMMAAPPNVMMVPTRPPQPILPPRPTGLLGMQLGAAVPAPLGMVPQLFSRPVLPQTAVPLSAKPIHEDEPPSKRAKTEDTLIPEDHWLAQRPGAVSVLVQVPAMPDKPEWNLNGQTLQFMFGPKEPCSAIKAKIAEALSMPAGKQKLQYDGLFIKDNNSLAFYNFMPESVVQLSTKERGGRKK